MKTKEIAEYLLRNLFKVDCEIEFGALERVPEWGKSMNQYNAKVIRHDKEVVFDFYQGKSIKDDPTLSDVVWSLMCDRRTTDNAATFADWCVEYGFNSDSISDRDIYNKCVDHTKALEEMFTYEELIILNFVFADY